MSKLTSFDHEQVATDNLLDLAVATKRQLERIKQDYTIICDEMSRRVEAGELDPGGFSHNDIFFVYSIGKVTWDHPEYIQKIEANLKTAKECAIAQGLSIKGTGAPFWTLKGIGKEIHD